MTPATPTTIMETNAKKFCVARLSLLNPFLVPNVYRKFSAVVLRFLEMPLWDRLAGRIALRECCVVGVRLSLKRGDALCKAIKKPFSLARQ